MFIGLNPLVGTYRRNNEGDYHCTEDEVGRMLADRSEESADSRILERFSLADLDPDSLRQFRNRFLHALLLTRGWRSTRKVCSKSWAAGDRIANREQTV